MAGVPGLLSGIRVLTLEQFIAGPYCTSLLADAGAEVIKIERPGTGDPRRSYDPRLTNPAHEDDYVSGGFASYNRGKRSVELDLASETGASHFRELLSTADALVSNLRPGTLARLGHAVEHMRREHPRLIVCEISGFGTTDGPYASWPAFDSVIQGMSGLASLQQDASGRPALAPMGSMDILAGVYAAFGIVTALAGRARTGVGSHVDAAMYDIGAAFLERPLTLQEFTGRTPVAGADDFSPVGTFRTGDGGWVSIVIPTDEMWRRCCIAVGRPEWERDPDLDTVLKRAERMTSHILPMLEQWAADKDRFSAVAALQAAGQPAGVVQTVADVRNCPQLAHRGLFAPFVDRHVPEGRDFRLARSPLLFDGQGALPGPVPDLGQDNEDVLGSDSSASERPR